ncbi:hypothetical protein [Nonomuraea sp. SYSU D8015]|uniref:hypothetical protein n=1 Tax=Nonomuraea sp. SYSU D8015 TaxID=2593644 RepID=UPI0016608543|nr:hypothetical protein [Nonomuraea sp. SYSU D8015]
MRHDTDLEDLRARVAVHIGAAELLPDERMRCPACGGDDFGPTSSVYELAVYKEGYLPGVPLLAGVCLEDDCGHVTEPRSTPVVMEWLRCPGKECRQKFPIESDPRPETAAAIVEHLMIHHPNLPTLWAIDRMCTWPTTDH